MVIGKSYNVYLNLHKKIHNSPYFFNHVNIAFSKKWNFALSNHEKKVNGMYLKKGFPYAVAGYLITVGSIFGIFSLIEGAFLDPEPPGSHFLVVISIIFICAGLYYIYLLSKGRLKESGKSIAEVRRESIKNLDDQALLTKIALKDQNPNIRKTAKKRLKDLNN
jgi:hypothetical protein